MNAVVKEAVSSHHDIHVRPRLNALLNRVSLLLTACLALGCLAFFSYSRLMRKAVTRAKRLVVFKDGAV